MNVLRSLLHAALVAVLMGSSACSRQESVQETREDVAQARDDGQKQVAEAKSEARERVAESISATEAAAIDGATPDATIDNEGDPSELATAGQYRVAMTEARATHKVEIEKCEAFVAEERRHCMDKADTAFENAKREADRLRDRTG